MVPKHDHGYKRLFSHPEMVADLLRGFVHEDWVRELDFATLERYPGSYTTRKLRSRRESDVVWRVRWREGRWLYVYILLEFQSTVDPFMALRFMVYLGLFYQDLLRHHELTPAGKLPPVLPLLLYNGRAPWGAAREMSELIDRIPGGLEQYLPQLRYCLLDEERIAESELESLRNLAAALFRLEKSRGPQDVEQVLTALLDWLDEPELAELKRSFAEWVVEVLLPGRMPGIEIPQVPNLQEVRSMLAERVIEWTQQWKQEGREEGLDEVRGVLLQELERRFGALPEGVRRRVDEIGSFKELSELILRVGSASSISELGLAVS